MLFRSRAIPPTTREYRVKRSVSLDPTVGSRSNFFHEFPEAVFDGGAWNWYDTLAASGLGHPPTALENRVKSSITIDPTVGSRSNFFREFPKAVFEGVAWNRYDTLTVSGRGHSNDSATEPGQKFHNYRADRWIALKFFSRVSDGCFQWSGMDSV